LEGKDRGGYLQEEQHACPLLGEEETIFIAIKEKVITNASVTSFGNRGVAAVYLSLLYCTGGRPSPRQTSRLSSAKKELVNDTYTASLQ
tara:strand:+ start:953 stop:1219 length:267 start_codon:yes stop_codon:yes gene_type:complete